MAITHSPTSRLSQSPLSLRTPRNRTTEKSLPKVIKRIILAEGTAELLRAAPFTDLHGGNINDHRSHLLCKRDKVRQLTGRSRFGISAFAHQVHSSAG